MITVKFDRQFIIEMGASSGTREIMEFCRSDLVMSLILSRYGIDTTRNFKITYIGESQEFTFEQEDDALPSNNNYLLKLILNSLEIIMFHMYHRDTQKGGATDRLLKQINKIRELK